MSISMKLPYRQLFACAALVLSLILCTVAGQMTPSTAEVLGNTTASADPFRDYLASFGWETDGSQPTAEEVTLPDTFGAVYADYLTCQRACGFSLEDYAGKTVTRYSYRVTNYPTGEQAVLADLLVYQGEVVGGDIRSADLDGFLHSLIYPG